ncbi:UNVERIFIED_CONTAM: hypothetical protein FKN15_059980 [Acipenser sinensis]
MRQLSPATPRQKSPHPPPSGTERGKEYWRFEDGVLDPDYPRDISEGFSGIPDNVDAAFALPAANYRGKEKVYFFKGSQYYQYEFRKQPTQQECSEMEPSTLFSRYTALQYDIWEDIFSLLFKGSDSFSSPSPRLISRDWKGLPGPVDAVMAARLYVAPKTQTTSSKKSSKASRKRSYKRRRGRKQKHRQDRSVFWDVQDLGENSDRRQQQQQQQHQWQVYDYGRPDYDGQSYLEFMGSDEDYDMLHKCHPIQSIYFFIKGSDSFSSPGPRLISRDWKGLPGPVDAVMAARLYVAPKTQTTSSKKSSKASRKRSYKRRRGRKQKHRQDRSVFWDLQDLGENSDRRQQQQQQHQWQGYDYGRPDYDGQSYLEFMGSDEDYDMLHKCQPIQSIYFFIKDKYYRVNLRTKRVDIASPPYPRSIAKYWLGCPEKGGAERK